MILWTKKLFLKDERQGKSNSEKCTVRTWCIRTTKRGESKLGEISWFNSDMLLMLHRRKRRKKD